jgi:hypothetical protein
MLGTYFQPSHLLLLNVWLFSNFGRGKDINFCVANACIFQEGVPTCDPESFPDLQTNICYPGSGRCDNIGFSAFDITNSNSDSNQWQINFYNHSNCSLLSHLNNSMFCGTSECCPISFSFNGTDLLGFVVSPQLDLPSWLIGLLISVGLTLIAAILISIAIIVRRMNKNNYGRVK